MIDILLIDDDKDFRALLRPALDSIGFNVDEARTLAEANMMVQKKNYHILVVDGLLPDGSGIQFIEKLRVFDQKVRIIFLSAFFRDMRTFHHLAEDLDVSSVSYKPIDLPSFTAKVCAVAKEVIENSGADMEVPTPPEMDEEETAFVQEIAELRREFALELPARLDEIEDAVNSARSNPELSEMASMLIHRLRGSAGTYGFPGVGDALTDAEEQLSKSLPAPNEKKRSAEHWSTINLSLHRARIASSKMPDLLEGSQSASLHRNKSLLVVDDDEAFCKMVRAAARPMLVNVITARSVQEALTRIAGQALSGAILDIHLGDEKSFELARSIRQIPENCDIPIAFASVDGRIETRVDAIEAGGSRFFSKPVEEGDLSTLVQNLLEMSRSQQGTVLIIDDDPVVVKVYGAHLRSAGYRVESLSSADNLVEKLDEVAPDLLLLDVNLPHMSGIDICKALRMSQKWELLPVILISAQSDTVTRVRAFRAGASDVITKPVIMEELRARVNAQQARVHMMRERADRDSLSGLWLRRPFLEALKRSLAACRRETKPLSLVMIDIDRFKAINDTRGHLAGDRVIASMGDFLRRRFRLEDLRARWGGEEFVLVFPGQGPDFAQRAVDRLRQEFSAFQFSDDSGETFAVNFTAGVSSYPSDATTIDGLLSRADELLYEGKRLGRARVIAGHEIKKAS